ncbi:hypothetical protein ACFV0R_06960 [Streptomyces sp. NPDC059578]|uniref:hypothetical protein n=1 Tax=Streptomyces sp. NPDC059578 TaxID=3346874 RepID=UPI0036B19BBD
MLDRKQLLERGAVAGLVEEGVGGRTAFQRQADLSGQGVQEVRRLIEVVHHLFRGSQRHDLAHPERLEAAESVEVVLVARVDVERGEVGDRQRRRHGQGVRTDALAHRVQMPSSISASRTGPSSSATSPSVMRTAAWPARTRSTTRTRARSPRCCHS